MGLSDDDARFAGYFQQFVRYAKEEARECSQIVRMMLIAIGHTNGCLARSQTASARRTIGMLSLKRILFTSPVAWFCAGNFRSSFQNFAWFFGLMEDFRTVYKSGSSTLPLRAHRARSDRSSECPASIQNHVARASSFVIRCAFSPCMTS